MPRLSLPWGMPLSGPAYTPACLVKIQLIGGGGGVHTSLCQVKVQPRYNEEARDRPVPVGRRYNETPEYLGSKPPLQLSLMETSAMSVLFFQKVC